MGSSKKQKFSKNAYFMMIVAVFMIIILVLIVVIEVQKKADLKELFVNIIVSVLCSIIASIIYTIMQKIFSDYDDKGIKQRLEQIEESLQRQNELYDNGIISIHPKTHFDNEDSYWNNIINRTNKRLDLIGHSISHWFKREYKSIFIEKLKHIVESGNSVNIILSASKTDMENLGKIQEVLLGKHEERVLSKIGKTILYLCQIVNGISEEKRRYLKVYVSDLEKVTYLYIRTDEQCIISPYIHGMDSNNSFLLELQPRALYVKSLEDDFEEMISTLEQVDLSFKQYKSGGNNLCQLRCIKTENRYSGSNWNFEKTEKYIYGDGFSQYEIGYFEHYKEKEYVKSVIELPVSYGCLSKCLFCASSNIESFEILRAGQMKFMFEDIYKSKELDKKQRVLLSLTGMGDIYFNEDNVFEFLLSLTEYKNLSITVSSSFWDTKLLQRVVELKKNLSIHYIQLTYISSSENIIAKLIPMHSKRGKLPKVLDFMNYVAKGKEMFYRINYVVISNVNDSEEEVNRFVKNSEKIKEKVVIRISQLNETNATKRNSLNTVSIDKLNSIKEMLIKEGFKCYVFYSYKNDNMNCGQLVTELPNEDFLKNRGNNYEKISKK